MSQSRHRTIDNLADYIRQRRDAAAKSKKSKRYETAIRAQAKFDAYQMVLTHLRRLPKETT